MDPFRISRGLTTLGRNRNARPEGLRPLEENGKGTTFRLDDIMRHWGAGQNISKEDVQRAIQKFMFHENGTDMRFSLTEDSQGHKVFIANSRSRDKGKGKGFGFKGDVFGFKGGKIGFKGKHKGGGKGHRRGRSRSPRSPVRRNGRRPEGRRSDRRGDASSDGSVRELSPGRGHERRRSRSPMDTGGAPTAGSGGTGELVKDLPPNADKPDPPPADGGNGWMKYSNEATGGYWYDHPGNGDGLRWVCFEDPPGQLGEVQAYRNAT
ncbi:unnamed protein product [Durusdinium trenchii]|uniref:2'-phosphotransferase n=1 Tax=Durusdinium trenchii TaxID=1381693 RepID=A0ABP0LUI6_9DINO